MPGPPRSIRQNDSKSETSRGTQHESRFDEGGLQRRASRVAVAGCSSGVWVVNREKEKEEEEGPMGTFSNPGGDQRVVFRCLLDSRCLQDDTAQNPTAKRVRQDSRTSSFAQKMSQSKGLRGRSSSASKNGIGISKPRIFHGVSFK